MVSNVASIPDPLDRSINKSRHPTLWGHPLAPSQPLLTNRNSVL